MKKLILILGLICFSTVVLADVGPAKPPTNEELAARLDDQLKSLQTIALAIDRLNFAIAKMAEDPQLGPMMKPFLEKNDQDWKAALEKAKAEMAAKQKQEYDNLRKQNEELKKQLDDKKSDSKAPKKDSK